MPTSFLSYLNFTFKVICLFEAWLHDAKHAENVILSNNQTINLHRQSGRAGGSVYNFIHGLVDFKHTYRGKAPSNKTQALTKSINMDILVVGTLNQLLRRSSYTEIKFSNT